VALRSGHGNGAGVLIDRTGHRSHEMIETYRRKARTWNLGELGPCATSFQSFPALNLRLGLPHDCPLNRAHGWRNWQTQRI
jgi:hypothetical protein